LLNGPPNERTDLSPSPEPAGGEPVARRVGFGCAGIMQCPSGRQRQRLLAEAFDRGIRHFDVARMYGLGAAERELGQFARGRREQLVIATKFGIEASGAAGRLAPLQAPARAVVARLPALRRALKRRADAFHQPHRYDAATARTSLETSLKELGTDYVDILFVHGPAPGDLLDLAELSEALEQLRAAGLLRAWGFAGDPKPCIELSKATAARTVVQIRDDIFDEALSPLARKRSAITFGVLAVALERILRHVSSSPERRARWSRAIGDDCGRSEVVASLLLQDALARNSAGAVLFSTTRPERVGIATAAAQTLAREPDPPPLLAFRELVLSELTPRLSAHRG
jgi:D-threo-aldose 1-dehydrogenase